jgi:hypothetical protein
MYVLSTNARHEYYTKLGNGLPPPVQHNQENHERRLTTAIETFEDLRPGDAYEASLAVEIVLSGAHAVECLREAGLYRDDFAKRTRCRAQASSMMRAESSAKRTLDREQKVRLAGEAVADAVRGEPGVAAAPPPHAERQAAAPQPARVPPVAVPPSPAAIQAAASPASALAAVAPPSPEAIAKAEAFARENLEAAAQIRHDGGVTSTCKAFYRRAELPTDAAVIDALVRGVSDVLTLLDEVAGVELEAAA